MAEMDHEYPIREEFLPLRDEYAPPEPDAEYRPPDPSREFSPPPGSDYSQPDEHLEFTPPGSSAVQTSPRPSRSRRVRRLLYAAAALVLTGLLFHPSGQETSPVALSPVPTVPAALPSAEPTLQPTPEPSPVSKVPVIKADFFSFSHEHHARLYLDNTDALHAVQVTVRETVLDTAVYEHSLTEAEIAGGSFELPMLSTGDVFMANMDAYDAVNGWPAFEMTVSARYENETGDGEDTLSFTVQPDFELGVGLSYWPPDWTWSEYIPADSFVVSPWEETEEIRYVINDPDAVLDPMTFSVDLSYNGRHAAPEEFEEIVQREEYTLVTADGEETPTVSYTKSLVLRRPDWMAPTGVIHVTICQRLASTGELWVRESDYVYPSD